MLGSYVKSCVNKKIFKVLWSRTIWEVFYYWKVYLKGYIVTKRDKQRRHMETACRKKKTVCALTKVRIVSLPIINTGSGVALILSYSKYVYISIQSDEFSLSKGTWRS